MDDKEIIEMFFARDEEAIKQTSYKYESKLMALATNILGSMEDGKECVNDAYLKAWNAIPPTRPTYFYAFLATITRHLAIDRIEKNNAIKRHAEIVELTKEMEECIADNRMTMHLEEENALPKAVSSYLKSIKLKKRIIFIRRYWYSDSIDAISRRMGMSEASVKVSLHRTRKELKDYLIKEGFIR